MAAVAELAEIKAFDFANATVSLWLFKKTISGSKPPIFSGRWVGTEVDLEAAMIDVASAQMKRIEEIIPYGLLAQNNEHSALSIDTLETHAGLLVDACAAEVPKRKVRGVKDVNNAKFYVMKFVAGADVLLAVRKTDASWQTRRSRGVISAVFSDHVLTLDQSPRFSISRRVDFFVRGDDILVTDKGNFESVMSHKQAHQADFDALQEEPEFKEIFSDIEALLDYVGENKIQLRRACAIRAKGFYKDATFLKNLRANAKKFGLNIEFDKDGLIVPKAEHCRDIFQALLDHRLSSAFSRNVYDVQDTAQVRV